MRLTLRALMVFVPLCAGCGVFGKKNKLAQPALPGKPRQVPGADMSKVKPTTARSQKPDQPPVIALPPATAADGDVKVKVVAYVNNMPIFDSEVRESLVMRGRELEGLS